MLLTVKSEDRAMFEVLQGQRPELDVLLAMQNAFCGLTLRSGDERHRWLMRQAQTPGTAVGRQPELDFRTDRGVAPMPGQDEALL
ncbi:hypothetical protein D3C78_1804500 [compost metagenome]